MKRVLYSLGPTGNDRRAVPAPSSRPARPTRPASPRAKRKARDASQGERDGEGKGVSFNFVVYVDEKSHLIVLADVREYAPEHGVWFIAAKCQRWRGRYLGQGQYQHDDRIGEPFELDARANSIDSALKTLATAAAAQCRGV